MLQKDKWSTQTHHDLYAEQHNFYSLKTCQTVPRGIAGFQLHMHSSTFCGILNEGAKPHTDEFAVNFPYIYICISVVRHAISDSYLLLNE